ncbi:MAG: hypothetical protein AB1411_08460 [Nitrospirota bacterium]
MHRHISYASSRQTAGSPAGATGRTSSRQGKQRAVERIKGETRAVHAGSLLGTLRKQGYEELPLDEIQDRLSKLRTALAEFVLSRRG